MNHLSTTLLSILLLPRMHAAAADGISKPRLVIVGSETHFWATIPKAATETPNILEAMNQESYFKTVYAPSCFAYTYLTLFTAG